MPIGIRWLVLVVGGLILGVASSPVDQSKISGPNATEIGQSTSSASRQDVRSFAVLNIDPIHPLDVRGGDVVELTLAGLPELRGESKVKNFLLELTESGVPFDYVMDSFRRAPNGDGFARFISPRAPNLHNAGNLTWAVTVVRRSGRRPTTVVDETGGMRFSYLAISEVRTVSADTVALKGSFPGLNFESGRASVLFNGNAIMNPRPIVTGEQRILFSPPEQPGPSLSYPVQVRIGSVISNRVNFTYRTEGTEPARVRIVPVVGAVRRGTSAGMIPEFDVSSQSNNVTTFVAEVSGGNIAGATFQWHLKGSSASSQLLTGSQVTLSGDSFTGGMPPYTLSVILRTGDGTEDDDEVALVPSTNFQIGALFQNLQLKRQNGEFQIMEVIPTEVNASPESQFSYSYTWQFNGLEFVWNASSPATGARSTSVNKLGRSFKIRSDELDQGPNQALGLKIQVEDSGEVVTSYDSTVQIDVPMGTLFAVINAGEFSSNVNALAAFNLTGTNSYNDSIIPSDGVPPNEDLSYNWIQCEYSTTRRFSSASKDCSQEIIGSNKSAKQFLVSSSQWQEILGEDQAVFVRLSLQVSTAMATSDVASSVLAVRNYQSTQALPSIDDFEFTDLSGRVFHAENINYLSALVITPVVSGGVPDGGFFRYSASSTDFPSDAFLNAPGSYQTPNSNGTSSLAISAGFMKPATTYNITILYSVADSAVNSYVLKWKTINRPLVTFQVNSTEGTENTQFVFNILPNDLGNFFKVYYRLFSSEDLSHPQICLGGCSGNPVVTTFICAPGEYFVQAEVTDFTGSTVFTSLLRPPTSPISITLEEDLNEFASRKLRSCRLAGDDACLSMLAYCLSQNDEDSATVDAGDTRFISEPEVALDFATVRQTANTTTLISRSVSTIERIANTSVLNTNYMTSFILSLSAFAKRRESAVTEVRTVNEMLSALFHMVERAANETKLDIVGPTSRFLYDAGDLAVTLGGSHLSETDVNNSILDTDVVGSFVVPRMVLGQEACGSSVLVNSQYDGAADSSFGNVQWNCTVVCSSQQVPALLGTDHASLRICSKFAVEGRRSGVCFESFPDIVRLSNVQTTGFSNTTSLLKIIPVDLEVDPSELQLPTSCFNVTTAMNVTDSSALVVRGRGVSYSPQKTFPGPDVLQGQAYNVGTGSISSDEPNCDPDDEQQCPILSSFNFETNLFDVLGVQLIEATMGPTPTPTPSPGLNNGELAGVVIGGLLIGVLFIGICLVYFCLVARPPPVAKHPGLSTDFIERDVFGRGFIVDPPRRRQVAEMNGNQLELM
ncbi:hypothetical protein NDN08_001863 [Rhodosorus marinus]|uniref:PKD/REJ-like domain-containing protein n=1 Tax=Rhodosorus marinus TaxID=101924 RepID=A0AAV8UV14_9RHOD|nr:hypothetical protein NDN08_001863 [Rhodosorus marinus]